MGDEVKIANEAQILGTGEPSNARQIFLFGPMGLQTYSGAENLEASELFTGTPQVTDDATFQDRVSVRNQACCFTSAV